MFDHVKDAAANTLKMAGTAKQFGTGMVKGAVGFVEDTASSVKDLAVGGYKLATDAAYREGAWETAKQTAGAVKDGIGYAMEDPAGAANAIGDTVSSAYADFQAERALAAAQGRLAEFDGQMLSRGVLEVFSPGKLLKVGKVTKLGKVANKVPSLGKVTAKTEKVGDIAKKAPGPVQRCPLEKAAAPAGTAKPPQTSQKTGKTKAKKNSQKNRKAAKAGEPVSMATGEELLEREDFAIDGPVPLAWTRFYRSGQSGEDLQLGFGWLTPLDEWLDVSGEAAAYHDREGRTVALPLPEPGAYSVNLPEQIRLHHDGDCYRLTAEGEPDRIFAAPPGNPQAARLRLARWQNETGQSVELVYDNAGQVQALAASWGRVWLIRREGRRIAEILPARPVVGGFEPTAAPLVRYQYDAAGDLSAAADRNGHGERYAYQNHLITRRTLASGFSFHFEWDGAGPQACCVRSRGDGGVYDTRFEWTDSGISRATDSRGGVSEYMHDNHANLLWHTTPEGRTTRYAYTRDNLLHSVAEPGGAVTRYDYDGEGRVVAVTDPLGHARRFEYGGEGQPIKLTDPLGQTWRRGYDSQGRLTQTQDPQGGTARIAYNALGLPAQITDALGRTRTLLWDESARLVGETGFDGLRLAYHYDAEDRLIAETAQDTRATRYQYDAAGRLVAVQAPDGGTVKLEYNALGLLTKHIAADGAATEYRYADGLSQITHRIDPLGHVLSYRYDSERNLVGLVNANGEEYRLGYDKDENLIEETGFDGRAQRYRYGANGWLEAHAERHADGWQVTRFERDPLGRLLQKTAPDGNRSEYAYDPLGRLQSARNADSLLLFRYDALSQVIEESQNGAAVSHRYDAAGHRAATTAPDGRVIEYRHDAQGRLEAVLLDGQPLTRHRFDGFGQETARQQGAAVSHYDYDPAGRLLRQQTALQGQTSPLLARRYGYDPTGRLAQLDDLRHGATKYLYDPADRLVQTQGAQPERFAHDPAGNLVGIGQATGGRVQGGRLLMLGDRHFEYDGAGNRTGERRGTGGQLATRYRYDGDNRLVQAETPQGTSTYRYDPLGRRIEKATPQGITRFVYDGARLLTETFTPHGQAPSNGGAGQSLAAEGAAPTSFRRLYLFEPDSFRPLARIDSGQKGQAVYHYHLDHLGTPREMTDAQGRLAWSAQYRAYGQLAAADVQLVENNLRFQGQYFDSETGLHYNLNRHYDPSTGRFVHQDPIGLDGGENLYEYAPNPVNWVDPWGLKVSNYRSMPHIKGYQKHHIVPQALRGHEVIQKSGMDIHSRKNIIYLPEDASIHSTRTIHRGSHPKYTSSMQQSLDEISMYGEENSWNEKQYKKATDKLVTKTRSDLRKGKVVLNSKTRDCS